MTDQHPTRRPGFEVHDCSDGFMIHDPAGDHVHFLNHTAVLILEHCDGGRSVEDIAGLVAGIYSLPEPPLAEVESVVADFQARGLIDR